MRRRQAELQPARIVIITFASRAKAARALQPWLPFFEVWVDPEREAYRTWGLGSRWLGLLNLGTVLLYGRAFFHGKGWRPRQWDIGQLGGDAALDGDGLVRLWHAGRTPDDRPSIEALIRAVNPESRSAT